MTLDEYIELFEKPTFEVTVDTAELLGICKELKEARKLIKNMSRYIEENIDRRC